jgi:hypothetical protein
VIEEWRPVVGWEDRYEVSDVGRIRSKDMLCGARAGGEALRRGRVLVQVPKQGRYLAVTFAKGDRREQRMVHDVVAAAFIGPKPEGLHTLHRDDDKGNNIKENIRYGTPKENAADKKINGNGLEGEKHHQAKLTEEDVRFIRSSAFSNKELAEMYGVYPSHIWCVKTRKVWKHI